MKFAVSLLLALFWSDDIAKAAETVLGREKPKADAHYCRETTQEYPLVRAKSIGSLRAHFKVGA
jgi:hypothetical protein